jgi:hypothetical protein
MLAANKKVVRMTTHGAKPRKVIQQKTKEHEVLTKSAWKGGSRKR